MKRKWFQYLAGLLVLGLLGVVAYTVFWMPVPSEVALPNPNGYDDLVRAAGELALDSLEPATATAEQLRTFLDRNRPALDTARQGVGRRCYVPIQSTTNWRTNHLTALAKLKRLARGFQAEARFAEVENRYADAASISLECVRLGQQIGRGGVFIDRLVGFSVEAIGLDGVRSSGAHLNQTERAGIVRRLLKLETERDPVEVALACERSWRRRAFSLSERLGGWLNSSRLLKIDQSFEQKNQKIKAIYQQVRRELATPDDRSTK
jgi:hypothetical protein